MVFMGSLEFSVYGQVARKSSRPKLCLPKSELCHPKFLVKSPEMLSHAARNFITLSNTLASLLHLYHAFFVSSKIKERDVIYHLSRLFRCSSRVKEREILQMSLYRLFRFIIAERTRYVTNHSVCFVLCWFKERDMLHTLFIKKNYFVSLCKNSGDMTQHFGRLNSGFGRFDRIPNFHSIVNAFSVPSFVPGATCHNIGQLYPTRLLRLRGREEWLKTTCPNLKHNSIINL